MLAELVRRIVKYVNRAVLAPEDEESYEEHGVLFDLLRRIIGRWRTRNATTLAFSDDERAVMLERRQNDINEWGATELFVTAMGAEGLEAVSGGRELFDRALHFGRVLLEGGNANVQATLHTVLSRGDAKAEGFFRHLVHRLRTEAAALDRIREMDSMNDGLDGGGFDADDDDEDEDDVDGVGSGFGASVARIISIFKFLQLCCEGHNYDMQTVVRKQERSTKTFDLVHEAIALLCSECKSKKALTRMRRPELEVVVQLLDFLSESMEGPCAENQAAVAASGVTDVVMRIMGSSFRLEEDDNEDEHEHSGHALVGQLRASTMKLVSSMLEGREDDRSVHDTLIDKLGASTIKHCYVTAHQRIRAIDGLVATGSSWLGAGSCMNLLCGRRGAMQRRSAALLEERQNRLNELFELYSSASTLAAERPQLALELLPDGGGGSGSGGGGGDSGNGSSAKKVNKEKAYAEAHADIMERFDCVEVAWNGAVHRVYFQMPETERLAEVRKAQMLEHVDLGATRLADFVVRAGHLSDEMNYLMEQSEAKIMLFFKRQYFPFKHAVYFIVLLLNVTVLTSVSSEVEGGRLAFGESLGFAPARAQELTWVLAGLAVAGYLALLWYMLVVRAPIVNLRMSRRRKARLAAEIASSGEADGGASGAGADDGGEAATAKAEADEARRNVLAARRNRGPHARLLGWIGDIVCSWGDWSALHDFSVALVCFFVGAAGLIMRAQAPDSFVSFGTGVTDHHAKISFYLWSGVCTWRYLDAVARRHPQLSFSPPCARSMCTTRAHSRTFPPPSGLWTLVVQVLACILGRPYAGADVVLLCLLGHRDGAPYRGSRRAGGACGAVDCALLLCHAAAA